VKRRLAAAAGIACTAVVATAAPASAAPSNGMVLECEDGRSLTRSNGTSWWGLDADASPDGTVYVTRALKIESLGGDVLFEKSYGAGRPGPSDVCVAQHGPFPGEDYPGSRWTVTLQRTA
jgi:hypothetical protein